MKHSAYDDVHSCFEGLERKTVGELELRSWYSDECGHGCLCRVCAGTANQLEVVLECVLIVQRTSNSIHEKLL